MSTSLKEALLRAGIVTQDDAERFDADSSGLRVEEAIALAAHRARAIRALQPEVRIALLCWEQEGARQVPTSRVAAWSLLPREAQLEAWQAFEQEVGRAA